MKNRISIRFWGLAFSSALALFVFIVFNLDSILVMVTSVTGVQLDPAVSGKLTLSLLQSVVIFLTGAFLTIFLARFTTIETNISNVAREMAQTLPDQIKGSIAKVETQLISELE